MSVNSPPLGVTQSGRFELRAPTLEARTSAPAVADRPGRARGNAGDWAAGVDLGGEHRQAPAADACRRDSGGSGSPVRSARTGINLGSAGLTVTIGADARLSYVVTVGVAHRLSPVLVLGSIAALYALILLAPPLASTDIFSYQFYGRIGRAATAPTRTWPGPHAFALRSAVPVHRVEVDRHADGLRPGVHRAQLSAGSAVDPGERVRLQGDRGRLEPGDRGARLERRAPARRRSGQGGGARRAQPADRRLRHRRRPQRPADARADGRGHRPPAPAPRPAGRGLDRARRRRSR